MRFRLNEYGAHMVRVTNLHFGITRVPPIEIEADDLRAACLFYWGRGYQVTPSELKWGATLNASPAD